MGNVPGQFGLTGSVSQRKRLVVFNGQDVTGQFDPSGSVRQRLTELFKA